MGYGTLAGIIAVSITTVLDYQIRTDPDARPLSFTSVDAKVLDDDIRRDCTAKIGELQRQIDEHHDELQDLRLWRREHIEWSNKQLRETERWRGGIDADHGEFHRLLRIK